MDKALEDAAIAAAKAEKEKAANNFHIDFTQMSIQHDEQDIAIEKVVQEIS